MDIDDCQTERRQASGRRTTDNTGNVDHDALAAALVAALRTAAPDISKEIAPILAEEMAIHAQTHFEAWVGRGVVGWARRVLVTALVVGCLILGSKLGVKYV